MIDAQLMSYFKFDQDDLYANQSGRFTEKQRAHIIAKDKEQRGSSRGWGIFLMLVGLLGLVIAIVAGIATPDWGFRIGFGIGFGVIWPLAWGGLGYLLAADSFKKHDFKLAMVRGRANIVREEHYNSSSHTRSISYELHIGGHDFTVSGDTADVIFQGEEYIIYYVESTDEILSVEAIGKG